MTNFTIGNKKTKFVIGDRSTILRVDAKLNKWGDIQGTISDQTDLQTELDLKADSTDLNDYVPYTGATTNIDIGSNDLNTTGSIVTGDHDTTLQTVNVVYGTGSPPDAGTVTEGTLFVQYIE